MVTWSYNMALGHRMRQLEVLHPTHKHRSCLAQNFASAVEAGISSLAVGKENKLSIIDLSFSTGCVFWWRKSPVQFPVQHDKQLLSDWFLGVCSICFIHLLKALWIWKPYYSQTSSAFFLETYTGLLSF